MAAFEQLVHAPAPRPAHCPWTSFSPSTLDFCEENLCAWIVNPGNAWSCMAFVIGGFYLWNRAKNLMLPHLRLVAAASIGVGLLSFVLHATVTYWGEVLDLSSMYLIGGLMVIFNLQKLYPSRLNQKLSQQIYWGMFILFLTLTLVYRGIGIPLFALQIITACISEFILRKRRVIRSNYRWLVITLATFGISFGFWLLDVTRVWCDHSNHWINGHVVWHYCNALALIFYARYLESTHYLAVYKTSPGLVQK